ncbi:hypothetical protein [Herbidospora sp. NBRC 101105]|uniref:hypothetical protein n=1 Tax=Herbidospora sp. NBRC 101105 TaxID=3032195 RepID=UPI0024A498BA|nr:hypothetical protein [Herbidospora sp. NBRC 101105]GLX99229.1 hypothetical protein Hesp01_71790 [Herbidospora sp. NBRC 101105]
MIRRVSGVLWIDHGSFSILDLDGLSDRPDALDPWDLFERTDEDGNWLAATPNMAAARSRTYWHKAEFALELWDAEPPVSGENRTVELFSSSGKVRPTGSQGTSGPLLDLGAPERSWLMRAYRIPLPGPVLGDDVDPEDDDAFELAWRDFEEWRFQFWPPGTGPRGGPVGGV